MINKSFMAEIKYQYAYDENGLLVSINDYDRDSSKSHTFKCISCGNTLLPRAIGSKHRRAHFYHKSIVECSGETYLHKFGKLLIKRKFDNSDKFLISYSATKTCNNSNCKLRHLDCKVKEDVEINLKEFYDTCTEETNYNGFIADLLLTNSKRPNIPPVFIEIFVSHACDENKLNSGLRIIEIPIDNEQDIKEIEKTKIIKESWEPYVQDKKKKGIKFINFKQNFKEPMEKNVYRFIMPNKGMGSCLTTIKCIDSDHKILKDSQIELNIVNLSNNREISKFDALYWMARNKFLKRCDLCKFYYATMYEHNAYCRLSKKYGTPKFPEMNYAETCRSYHLKERYSLMVNDRDVYVEEVFSINKSKNGFRVIIAGSKSFSNYKMFKERCDHYLSEIKKEHAIIIITGTSVNTKELIERYAKSRSLLIEYCNANWGRYGQNAAYVSNEEMLENADAVIAFSGINDHEATVTNSLIKLAKSKNIQVGVVKYE